MRVLQREMPPLSTRRYLSSLVRYVHVCANHCLLSSPPQPSSFSPSSRRSSASCSSSFSLLLSPFSSSSQSPSSSKSSSWDRWEFGSFATRQRKRSEEQEAAKRTSEKGRAIKNIDDEWLSLSDQEVEVGISVLKETCVPPRVERLEEVLNKRTDLVRLVFENPHNPNNMWAALRTADSFGIQYIDIIVNEGHSPALMQRSMVQAMGSQKWLTLVQHQDSKDCIEKLRSQGYHIIASDLGEKSSSISELKWIGHNVKSVLQDCSCQDPDNENNMEQRKLAIVMGSESNGISNEMRNLADELFHLPMKGFAESFNLSAATAITCGYLDAMGMLGPHLKSTTKRRILLTWLARSVDGSMPILRRAGLKVGDSRRPSYASICGVSARP